MTKKKITVGDVVTERKKLMERVLIGEIDPITVCQSVFFYLKKSKKINKHFRKLNFYNLISYIKWENYLVRRSFNEVDFIKAGLPTENIQRLTLTVTARMNKCMEKYLKESEAFNVFCFSVLDGFALIEIAELGYFVLPEEMIKRFNIPMSPKKTINKKFLKKIIKYRDENHFYEK